MQLEYYSEISGVCTHPDYRKRGYGGGLTLFKCKKVQDRGKTPILGVNEKNVNAVRLYRKLGFVIQTTVTLDMLQRK
jgi:predicted GNAT family acetyltransferase